MADFLIQHIVDDKALDKLTALKEQINVSKTALTDFLETTTKISAELKTSVDSFTKLTESVTKYNEIFKVVNKTRTEFHKNLQSYKTELASYNKLVHSIVDANKLASVSIKNINQTIKQETAIIKEANKATKEEAAVKKEANKANKDLDASNRFVTKSTKQAEAADKSYTSTMKKRITSVLSGLIVYRGVSQVMGLVTSTIKNWWSVNVQLEASLATLNGVLGITRNQAKILAADAVILSNKLGISAKAVIELQTELARMGFTMGEVRSMTEGVSMLSRALQVDSGKAAELVGSIIHSYKIASTDIPEYLDMVISAINKTALSFERLRVSVPIVFPVAKAFNVSMKDTLSLLGILANSGFGATQAATALRNIFLNLADANGKLATKLGASYNTVEGLTKALKELAHNGTNLNEVLELSDKRSVAALATFIATSESVLQLNKALEITSNTLGNMTDNQLNTTLSITERLKTAWDNYLTTLGNTKIPTNIFAKLLAWLNNLTTKSMELASITDPNSLYYASSGVQKEKYDAVDRSNTDVLDSITKQYNDAVKGKQGKELSDAITNFFNTTWDKAFKDASIDYNNRVYNFGKLLFDKLDTNINQAAFTEGAYYKGLDSNLKKYGSVFRTNIQKQLESLKTATNPEDIAIIYANMEKLVSVNASLFNKIEEKTYNLNTNPKGYDDGILGMFFGKAKPKKDDSKGLVSEYLSDTIAEVNASLNNITELKKLQETLVTTITKDSDTNKKGSTRDIHRKYIDEIENYLAIYEEAINKWERIRISLQEMYQDPTLHEGEKIGIAKEINVVSQNIEKMKGVLQQEKAYLSDLGKTNKDGGLYVPLQMIKDVASRLSKQALPELDKAYKAINGATADFYKDLYAATKSGDTNRINELLTFADGKTNGMLMPVLDNMTQYQSYVKLLQSNTKNIFAKVAEQVNEGIEKANLVTTKQILSNVADFQKKLIATNKEYIAQRVHQLDEEELQAMLSLSDKFRTNFLYSEYEYELEKTKVQEKYALMRIKVQEEEMQKALDVLSAGNNEVLQIYNTLQGAFTLDPSLGGKDSESIIQELFGEWVKSPDDIRKLAQQIDLLRSSYSQLLSTQSTNLNNKTDKRRIVNAGKDNTKLVHGTDVASDNISNILGSYELEAYNTIMSQMTEIAAAYYDYQLQRIEEIWKREQKWYDERKDIIERNNKDGLMSNEEAAARKLIIDETVAIKEKEYEKRKHQLQVEAAKWEKAANISSAIQSTAAGIAASLKVGGVLGIALAAIVGALGAAQVAAISAQKIPEYATGTDFHKGGLAVVGDGGKKEVIVSNGKAYETPDSPTLINLKRGAKVYSDYDSYLNNYLGIRKDNSGVIYDSKMHGLQSTSNKELSDIKQVINSYNNNVRYSNLNNRRLIYFGKW